MNYFLMLIIIGLGCGGYYEYTTLQQQHAGDQDKLADLQAKLDPAVAESKKLEDDNAKLTKSNTEAQAEIADLTQQVQAAQTALAEAKQQAFDAQKKANPPAATTTPASLSNDLGNITTLDGKSYQACKLLKVQADCIVVNDSTGITQVPYGLMPPDLQKRFGFDPHVSPALTDTQVEALEEKRKAAAPVTGN